MRHGQGDRLRSYERGTPTWTLRNEAQDLAGGLSALVSDGTADYAYLSPGDGSAPLSSYTPATSRAAYLGTDLLGSVRLATDPAGATIGAGAYDAWGVARPYTGGSGATQLAGLQGVAPFGYAGQQRDAGPGTYAMRARRYDPATGRFQSQDPLAYSPQVPVTINPYEYAGNMPTGVTDPSGQGWTFPDLGTPFGDYQQQSAIAGRAPGVRSNAADLMPGQLEQTLSPASTRFWVPVLKHPRASNCDHPALTAGPGLAAAADSANVIDLQRHMYWDIEHVDAGNASLQPRIDQIVREANVNGFLWLDPGCRQFNLLGRTGCPGQVLAGQGIEPGTGYPQSLRVPGAQTIDLGDGVTGTISQVSGRPNRALIAWQPRGTRGLILYAIVPVRIAPICSGVLACLFGAANLLVFDDFRTLFSPNAPWYDRALAAVGVVGDVFFVAKFAKVGSLGARFAGAAGTLRLGAGLGSDLRNTVRAAYDAWKATCGHCFPAGTGVATTKGTTAIERLKVGDTVLSEDPKTGTVEPEAVQAVIDDGVKSLIALDLSDGSTLKVTGDHPFWVDGGGGMDHPGWLEAGQLRPGDRLRTADGRGITVLAVHWNVGTAHVYTLTVATDHTFFVGSARVLVHNGEGSCPTIGNLVYNHFLKSYAITDKAVLEKQIQAQVDAMNRIIAASKDGILELKRRIRNYPNIVTEGRDYAKGLGSAGVDPATGETLAWLHEPDMQVGGLPTDVNPVPGVGRYNSIIGGQSRTLARAILDMPDSVKTITWSVTYKK